jgi:YggT family protein
VRRSLASFGIQPNGAPLITILLTILIGYFVMMLVMNLLNTAAGVYVSILRIPGGVIALFGYLLNGMLSLYSLLIIIRVIFSWGNVSYGNRVMRFLINATDPILVPLRQMLPRLGPLDISPLVALLIVWLFQTAVIMTLLRGWPVMFVG